MTTRWKTLGGHPIDDISAFVERTTQDGQPIHIGTDSLQTGRWTQYVTVVIVLNPPHGGRVAYIREIVPRIVSLRQRLMGEAWRSVNVAMSLPARGEMTVHIDANAQERHMSQKYLQELVGLVVGQGFKAVWKPQSWAASTVADHVVRTMGRLPKEGAAQGGQPVLKIGVA